MLKLSENLQNCQNILKNREIVPFSRTIPGIVRKFKFPPVSSASVNKYVIRRFPFSAVIFALCIRIMSYNAFKRLIFALFTFNGIFIYLYNKNAIQDKIQRFKYALLYTYIYISSFTFICYHFISVFHCSRKNFE